ncbi:hypothetical protein D3OALGA1CA_2569 [Olavius algarvensis associated proteobacterium Delta 3]|nr:hypothetical protein D3OALGA1CA_2569 [Olavius algarvensis associated proteobacterium Delta 3]
MQDPGYKIQGLGDLESWILDSRYWMLVAGYLIIDGLKAQS